MGRDNRSVSIRMESIYADVMRMIPFILIGLFCCIAQAQTPQEIEFIGANKMTLHGTLRMPAFDPGAPDDAEVPAVLFIAGSGPTDRDGNQPGLQTDLLKQWAEGLQARGVASLSFDKRAVARYQDKWPKTEDEIAAFFSVENHIGDVKAAYEILRSRPQINSKRVFILGHSEGGLFALLLGNQLENAPAGIILASTPGRKYDDLIREQINALLEVQLPDEVARKPYVDALEAAINATKNGKPIPASTPPGLRPLFNASTKIFLKELFALDPKELASTLKCPVLVMQGENDLQVSAERDLPLLTQALESRKNASTYVVVVPKSSHNFKETKDKNDPAFTGNVIPKTIDEIAGWVNSIE